MEISSRGLFLLGLFPKWKNFLMKLKRKQVIINHVNDLEIVFKKFIISTIASKRCWISISGKDLSKVDKIQADVFNPSSVLVMVRQCQVVLNCVGPYLQWGEPVVKACAEEGTHHLDLSGEAIFHGKMEQKYTTVAEESGAYIIGACGFDSIPADCGAMYLQQNFEGKYCP